MKSIKKIIFLAILIIFSFQITEALEDCPDMYATVSKIGYDLHFEGYTSPRMTIYDESPVKLYKNGAGGTAYTYPLYNFNDKSDGTGTVYAAFCRHAGKTSGYSGGSVKFSGEQIYDPDASLESRAFAVGIYDILYHGYNNQKTDTKFTATEYIATVIALRTFELFWKDYYQGESINIERTTNLSVFHIYYAQKFLNDKDIKERVDEINDTEVWLVDDLSATPVGRKMGTAKIRWNMSDSITSEVDARAKELLQNALDASLQEINGNGGSVTISDPGEESAVQSTNGAGGSTTYTKSITHTVTIDGLEGENDYAHPKFECAECASKGVDYQIYIDEELADKDNLDSINLLDLIDEDKKEIKIRIEFKGNTANYRCDELNYKLTVDYYSENGTATSDATTKMKACTYRNKNCSGNRCQWFWVVYDVEPDATVTPGTEGKENSSSVEGKIALCRVSCELLKEKCDDGDDEACREYEEDPKCSEVQCTTWLGNVTCTNTDSEFDFKEGMVLNGSACTEPNEENPVKCVIDNQDAAGNSYEAKNMISNDYCSVWCKEDYHFKVPGQQASLSGRYFTLQASITGTKTCYTPKLNREKFEEDYEANRKAEVDAFNKWNMLDKLNKKINAGDFETHPQSGGWKSGTFIPYGNFKLNLGGYVGTAYAFVETENSSSGGGTGGPSTPPQVYYLKFNNVQVCKSSYDCRFVSFKIKLNSNVIYIPYMELKGSNSYKYNWSFDAYNPNYNNEQRSTDNGYVSGTLVNELRNRVGRSNSSISCGNGTGYSVNCSIELYGTTEQVSYNTYNLSMYSLPNNGQEVSESSVSFSYNISTEAKDPEKLTSISYIVSSASSDLSTKINQGNTLISNYNSCANWTIDYNFDPKISFDYEEAYMDSFIKKELETTGTTSGGSISVQRCGYEGEYKENFDNKEFKDTIDSKYSECKGDGGWSSGNLMEDIDKMICESSGGSFNCDVKKISVTRTLRIKESYTKSGDYITPTQAYNLFPSGTIGIGEENQDIENSEILPNKLPVAYSTGQGVWTFALQVSNLGEYYDKQELGRVWGKSDSVVVHVLEENSQCYSDDSAVKSSVKVGGDTLTDGVYVCAYKVNCPDCPVVCDEDGCYNPDCPANNCPVICDKCLFTNGDINVNARPVTPGDINPNDRNLGVNWSSPATDGGTSGSGGAGNNVNISTALELKAYATTTEIQNDGEDIYDITFDSLVEDSNDDFSMIVYMDSNVINFIKTYNTNNAGNGGFANSTLKCYDHVYNGQTYKNVYCYSTFIDELVDKFGVANNGNDAKVKFGGSGRPRTEAERNRTQDSGYWTTWSEVTGSNWNVNTTSVLEVSKQNYGTNDIGPSWK